MTKGNCVKCGKYFESPLRTTTCQECRDDMKEQKKCHLCRKPYNELCPECRAWKETRYSINKCTCDVCYEVDHLEKL